MSGDEIETVPVTVLETRPCEPENAEDIKAVSRTLELVKQLINDPRADIATRLNLRSTQTTLLRMHKALRETP